MAVILVKVQNSPGDLTAEQGAFYTYSLGVETPHQTPFIDLFC